MHPTINVTHCVCRARCDRLNKQCLALQMQSNADAGAGQLLMKEKTFQSVATGGCLVEAESSSRCANFQGTEEL